VGRGFYLDRLLTEGYRVDDAFLSCSVSGETAHCDSFERNSLESNHLLGNGQIERKKYVKLWILKSSNLGF
jgi:hypothetical protein